MSDIFRRDNAIVIMKENMLILGDMYLRGKVL